MMSIKNLFIQHLPRSTLFLIAKIVFFSAATNNAAERPRKCDVQDVETKDFIIGPFP